MGKTWTKNQRHDKNFKEKAQSFRSVQKSKRIVDDEEPEHQQQTNRHKDSKNKY
jgi:hypothetical protein